MVELSNHGFDSLAVLRNISQTIKLPSDSWSFYSLFFYCQGLVSIFMKRAKDSALFNVFPILFYTTSLYDVLTLNTEVRLLQTLLSALLFFSFAVSQSVCKWHRMWHCKDWQRLATNISKVHFACSSKFLSHCWTIQLELLIVNRLWLTVDLSDAGFGLIFPNITNRWHQWHQWNQWVINR